jgi:sigma-E factor negative regulatory protein RseC
MTPNLLEQHAVVTRIDKGTVWVEAREPSGCGSCGGSGCASRRLAELFRIRQHGFRVQDTLGVKVGENVWVGYPEGTVLRGAMMAYGLPLFLTLSGGLLGHGLLHGDTGSVGGAILGLFLGLIILWLDGHRQRALPVIIRRERSISPPGFSVVSSHY